MIDAYDLADDWRDQAQWRHEKSHEFPDDDRNQDAVKIWELLAQAAKSGEISPDVLNAYCGLWDEDGDNTAFVETQSQVYREVGFHFFPDTPNELLDEIVSRLRPRSRAA